MFSWLIPALALVVFMLILRPIVQATERNRTKGNENAPRT